MAGSSLNSGLNHGIAIGAVLDHGTVSGTGVFLSNSIGMGVTACRDNTAGSAVATRIVGMIMGMIRIGSTTHAAIGIGIIGSTVGSAVRLGGTGSAIRLGGAGSAGSGVTRSGGFLRITAIIGADTADKVMTGSGNLDLAQFLFADSADLANHTSFGTGCGSGLNLNSVSCQRQFLGMLVAAGLAGEGLAASNATGRLDDLDLAVVVTQVQTTLAALVVNDLMTGFDGSLAFDQVAVFTLLICSITVYGAGCFQTILGLHSVAQRCGIFITDEVTALANGLFTALYGAGSIPLLDNFVMMTSCGNPATFSVLTTFALALVSAPALVKTGGLSGDEVAELQIVTQTGAIIVAILGIVTFGALNSGEVLSIIAVCRSALFGFYQSVFMVTHMQTVNTGIHQICRSSRVHMMATGCNRLGTLMTTAFTLTGEGLDTILKTGSVGCNITHVVIMAQRIGDNLSLLHILTDLTLLSSSGITDFTSCGCCLRDFFIVVHTFSLTYGTYTILPGVAQAYTIMVAILGIVTNSALNSGEVFSIIAVSRSALFGFFQSVFVVTLETANLTLVRSCRVVGMTQSIDNFTTTQDFIAIITHITASDTISYTSCRSTDFPSLVLMGAVNLASLALAIHNVMAKAFAMIVAFFFVVTYGALFASQERSCSTGCILCRISYYQSTFVVALLQAVNAGTLQTFISGIYMATSNANSLRLFYIITVIALLTDRHGGVKAGYSLCRNGFCHVFMLTDKTTLGANTILKLVTQRGTVFKVGCNQHFLANRALGTSLDLGSGAVCRDFRNLYGSVGSRNSLIRELSTIVVGTANLAQAILGAGGILMDTQIHSIFVLQRGADRLRCDQDFITYSTLLACLDFSSFAGSGRARDHFSATVSTVHTTSGTLTIGVLIVLTYCVTRIKQK